MIARKIVKKDCTMACFFVPKMVLKYNPCSKRQWPHLVWTNFNPIRKSYSKKYALRENRQLYPQQHQSTEGSPLYIASQSLNKSTKVQKCAGTEFPTAVTQVTHFSQQHAPPESSHSCCTTPPALSQQLIKRFMLARGWEAHLTVSVKP